MRYLFSTRELITFLTRPGVSCAPHSPFAKLAELTLSEREPCPLTEDNALTQEGRLLERFLLDPDRVYLLGRQSAADGTIYALRKEGLFCLYTYLRKQDFHVFFLYLDAKRLAKIAPRLLYGFYRPDLPTTTSLACVLTRAEYTALMLCCMDLNLRTAPRTLAETILTPQELARPDLALYLTNFFDEEGRHAASERLTAAMTPEALEPALAGLAEKGILTRTDVGFRPTQGMADWLDQGLLIDTVYCGERVTGRETFAALRRTGMTLITPDGEHVTLLSAPGPDWEKIFTE